MARNFVLEAKTRILKLGWERKEFIRLEDGYWYWWPTDNHGAYSSADLRVIADLLWEANRKWDNELMEFFANNP